VPWYFFLKEHQMTNVIPLHKRARDGRRILSDGSVIDLQQYARAAPESRSVQLNLPTALIEKIDTLAKAELLPRSAWLRARILAAIREADDREAMA
jgi:hypothetical protein